MSELIKPPDEDMGKEDESNSSRRSVLKTIGATATGAITSLAGCQGSNQSSGNHDREVETIEVLGETQKRGVVHYVLKMWAETANEETPFNVNFKPVKHTQVVQRLMFEQSVHMGSLYFGVRPHRIDPHMLLYDVFHSDNKGCGTYQWTSYADEQLDKLLDKEASTFDRKERQQTIHKIQKKLATVDGNVNFGSVRGLMHPKNVQLYNKKLFNGVQTIPGLGIRNIWTWNDISPIGNQTDLVVPVSIGATNLTPLFSGTLNLAAVRNVYDKLTQIGPKGKPKPWLAKDWTVADDDKTITFNLRQGHSFHDGTEVTAEDVVFTYRFMEKSPFLASPVKWIESAEAVDKSTVKMTLTEPFAPIFLFTFSRVPILPKHVWKNIPESVGVSKAVEWSPSDKGKFFGSGHFEFDHWRKGSELVLKANQDHFNPPNVDKIVFRLIKNSQVALDMMKSGDAHLMYSASASPDVVDKVGKNNNNLKSVQILSVGNHPLIFNTNAPPLGFEEVRAALESVAPKQEIVQGAWDGYGQPAFGNISPAVPFWYNDNQKKWGKNYINWKDTGKSLLTDSGFVINNDKIYYPKGEAPEHTEPLGCKAHQTSTTTQN